MQLRCIELENVRVAQFTPRLAQALSQLTRLACTGEASPLRQLTQQATAAHRWLSS